MRTLDEGEKALFTLGRTRAFGGSFKPDSIYRQNIWFDIDGVESPKLTEVTDISVCNSKAFR